MSSKKQKIWNFLRRNTTFSVYELLIIFELNISYAKWLLWWLRKNNIVALANKGKRFDQNTYKVVAKLPVKSPPIRRKERV
jgi:restriction endonuclease S subunit